MSTDGPSKGLSRVLFIRTTPELLEALDRITTKERAENPGRVISRADVARGILHKAIKGSDQ